ncbi:hypothetical protein P5G50_12555 [Leifsonia sp. F6_8S_P_1B]|uniref:4'-phosphopantetheinyl transferase domain-containing protein n=1 Tax=Leifsonia williamsii TaxID=3035919 RepID=A0ABT8KCT2_9MICO|nr:4'-phosphopantetheinyl transferase superfamily protein [Leifsonia williamsii]MDN4615278.1 hypothetical protein [Leifsonia williamsii]
MRVVVVRHGSAAASEVARRLSAGDRERLASLADDPEAVARFLAGRQALLTAAERSGFPEVAIDATCPDCGRSHGRPRAKGEATLHLALSHAAGHAFAVAASAPVGIDAEALDTDPARLREAAALLAHPVDRPRAALRAWTATEAVLKADGRGLRVDPSAVRLGPRIAVLDGSLYRLSSRQRAGCRVAVARLLAASVRVGEAQAVSEGRRRSRSQASKKSVSPSPA